MNVLVLCGHLVTPDRSAGDFRLCQLLHILATDHRVDFCVLRPDLEQIGYTASERRRYESDLTSIGVNLLTGQFPGILRVTRYDEIWFEFHHAASEQNIRQCRFEQPDARIVVDSVDVHFNRLTTKARLTGRREDTVAAELMRRQELLAYRRSDMVIAVSEDDKQLVEREDEQIRVAVIPLIHPIPEQAPYTRDRRNRLLFVGGFGHEPNIDAMLYFCREVLPRIREAVPDTSLSIVGNDPPARIRELGCDGIEVTGYVPSTEPYLTSHAVSIAPLRYGGGMKGKISEAMSYGLPVVSTSIGIEGFALTPDKHVLVGDTAATFAECVVRLLRDPGLATLVGESGRSFLRSNYSSEAVEKRILRTLEAIQSIPPKRLAIRHRASMFARRFYRDHVAWRVSGERARATRT